MTKGPDPEAPTMAAPLEPALAARATLPDEGPVLVADRYELLGMLGAGGMGTVYRVRDRELDEIVALKMLRKELAAAPGMLDRFRREVKLARRVTHRNVARTFDIGEHEGDRYLTMEFIEGEMLGALAARLGRLTLRDAVRIGVDVCAGLSAAHEAGVLHRDLKPENVIVAKDGRAVITDFGIARAASVSAELGKTAGGFVGTPAYMAPEQVEGAADLDARADLYALGAMLYELLTGELAWKGDSLVTIAAGRLLHPPPDPRTVARELPAPAAELVLKLMARHRQDRYASAEETARALSELSEVSVPRVSVPAAAPQRSLVRPPVPGTKTIAVLPVTNLGSPDDAYLVESVTEDIIDLLSVVPGLLVRHRGETARFTSQARDVREAGRTLGVDVVVDGTLRRINDVARVSVRLVTVEDGFQLWAHRFERPAAQVLSIADDAAHAIARALTTELASPAPARPVSDEAQDLFLRGRWLCNRAWVEVNTDAVDLLGQAHARAPEDARIAGTYALALARAYASTTDYTTDLVTRAQNAATRAMALDASRPESRVANGILELYRGDIEAAVTSFRLALAVAPNSVEALDGLGRIICEVGRAHDGIDLCLRAVAIEPDYGVPRFHAARIRGLLGDHEGFLATLGPPPQNTSDLMLWTIVRTRDILWRRDRAEAMTLVKAIESYPFAPRMKLATTGMLGVTISGQLTPEQRTMLHQFLPLDSSRPPRRVAFNAQLYAEMLLAAGVVGEVMPLLEIGDAAGLVDMLWIERCPLLAPLRQEPRFQAFCARVQARASRVLTSLDKRISYAKTA